MLQESADARRVRMRRRQAAQCFDKALQSGIPRTDEREAVERLKSECKP